MQRKRKIDVKLPVWNVYNDGASSAACRNC